MENRNLQREIDIKNSYLQMIKDIAFDYDGCEDTDSLKNLVDELSYYASLALNSNDTEPIYTSYSNGVKINSNILMEDLED